MIAAIGADVFVENAAPHGFLEYVIESFGDLLRCPTGGLGCGGQLRLDVSAHSPRPPRVSPRRQCCGGQLHHDVIAQGVYRLDAFAFQRHGCQHRADSLGHKIGDAGFEGLRQFEVGIVALGFANGGAHLILELDNALNGLVRQLQRFHHQFFFDFVRAGLDHDDGVGAAGDAQVQAAFRHLRDRGVDDELTVDIADAHTGDGAIEGDVRYGQRCRGRDDPQRIHVLLVVTG